MCAEIIEEFQKCHLDHPIAKFFGECTELKIKLDRCFRQEKAVKRKANFEENTGLVWYIITLCLLSKSLTKVFIFFAEPKAEEEEEAGS
ncbi:Cytochrome c oxidase biogenesis protein Cmc1-like protein [Corchorus capsularis]|uniref:COX assembly mitochondrial protein n=1 Tax=Corchorus capsularis TaxID=210143 RepID=A0A1R3HYG8_COCAP|nr:Cytochrome c oxidase biogenesis protein Cmc1-like protein [Corchorus capsularis]